MIYILLLIFLFTGVPLSFAQGSPRKVLDLSATYPSPFGKYQKLDTAFFRYAPTFDPPPVGPPPPVACDTVSGYDEYMYLGTDGNQYVCNGDLRRWEPYTPGLWGKSPPDFSIYPIDIDDENDLFSLGIGTTQPQARLHVLGDSAPSAFDPQKNRYTSIRLQHKLSLNDDDNSTWELRTYEEYRDLDLLNLNPRKKIFTIWGTALSDVLFITEHGNFYLIDNVKSMLGGGGDISEDPKLTVQRQEEAYDEGSKLILGNGLAAAFTHNVEGSSHTGVGIGFGVDYDTSNRNYQQLYGAAIAHERTDSNSVGKLHFATRNKDIVATDRDLPVQMTLDEIGNLGLGTTSPQFQLSLQSNDVLGTGGILAKGTFGNGPSIDSDGLTGSLFLWSPRKASLNAGYYLNALMDKRMGNYSVAFGNDNFAAGEESSVLGGISNVVAAKRSAILGGSGNRIDSEYSLAFGGNIHLNSSANNTFAWGYAADGFEISAHDAFIIATGDVAIGARELKPNNKVYIKGNLYVDGTISYKNVYKIPGGISGKPQPGSELPNFDIAEVFETTEEVEAGDVLVADPQGTVKLQKSRVAYEKNVIGIASSNPAIIFEDNENQPAEEFIKGTKPPVALAGRVPCKVTNENGPIEVGDLLTSSSVPGHAMKATDREKSFGAILGKALEPFTAGPKGEPTGKIVVFVTMQ